MNNLSYAASSSIATITWDLPGRSMNVLTEDSLREFAECVEKACADAEVKGILITSAKPAFIAGADLTMLGGASQRAGGSAEERAKALFEANLSFNILLRKLETCGKPVAAAINGTARHSAAGSRSASRATTAWLPTTRRSSSGCRRRRWG